MHNIAATLLQRRRVVARWCVLYGHIGSIPRRAQDVKSTSHQRQRNVTLRRPQRNPTPTPNGRRANKTAEGDHKKIGQDAINGILDRHARNILRQSLMSSSFCKIELQPENR